MSWSPILTDRLAARAVADAEEIAAELRRLPAPAADRSEPLPLNRTRFALAGGLAGQALFFAYLDRARPGRGYDETAVELLELAFEDLGQADATSGLYSGVVDAGLCHGAAGNGHLFHRLFRQTGDPALGEAARGWFERALDMKRSGEGIGGFPALVPDAQLELSWHADPSFLTGASGVGLALLAAATDIEPAWDRALLISA